MERDRAALLHAMENLSSFHREHEKYYASAPREQAVRLQRHARALQALADGWTTATPPERKPFSPYEGAEDLNASAAIQLDGVLFLEGEGEPAEIAAMKSELRQGAAAATEIGGWLATAMEASWGMAAALLTIPELADQIGERHRIIANDMHAAAMNTVIGRALDRAADVLDAVDFTPAALRADLAGPAVSAHRLYSAAELIGHAADLASDSAGLVHANERRWRIFHERVGELLASDGPADS